MLDTGIEHGHRRQVPGPTQRFRRGHVIGIAECLMRSPAAVVAPDFGATAGDRPRSGRHGRRPCGRLPPDAPSSRWCPGARSDRAAAGSWSASRPPDPPAAARASLLVRRPPVDRLAPQAPMLALVGPAEPVTQLGVEIRWAGEGPAGQERGFQTAVGALHQALGFGIARAALDHLGPQHPAEGVHRVGQLRLAAATDRPRTRRPTPALAAPGPSLRSTPNVRPGGPGSAASGSSPP